MIRGVASVGQLALVLLLVIPALAPLAEAQAASPTPQFAPYVICFQGYHVAPSATPQSCQQVGGNGPTTLDDANYFEGESVPMTLNVNTNNPVTFKVQCLTNCKHALGDTDGRVYTATWDGNMNHPVVFPDQFTDTSTSVSARAEGAGTYNSSWTVVAQVLGSTANPQRTFATWLMDAFVSDDGAVHPGELHAFRIAGFSDNTRLNLTLERRDGASWVPVALGDVRCLLRADGETCTGRYAIQEAANFAGCGIDLQTCYRVAATGTGKDPELVYYAVAPAHILPYGALVTDPPAAASAPYTKVERTQNITIAVALGYPGGDAAYQLPFTSDQALTDPALGTRAIRLAIERADVPGATPIATIPLNYSAARLRWVGTWTPPRDLPTNGSLVAYQLRLVETRDEWASHVDSMILANYTIASATLGVSIVKGLDAVPRTELADLALSIQYHDGTSFDPTVNSTPLTGCFIRDTQTSSDCTSAPSSQVVNLAYENGLWHARYRYPVDYATLGSHKFVLQQDQDRWNNTVPGGLTIPYQVVVGSPHVDFSTTFQGSSSDPIVRADDTLYLNAVITYGDGSSFNISSLPNPDGQTRTLTALVTKRTTDGIDVTTVPVALSGETYGPRWYGSMPIRSNSSDSPLGTWSIRLDVADNQTVPNVNHTEFNRTFIGAPLTFREEISPFDAEIGNKTRFRFSILRSGVDDSPAIDVGRTLTVQLYRWDPVAGRIVGDPIAKLSPPYNPDYHQYVLDYTIPPEMFDGAFVFVVRGGDHDGNMLLADGVSHPFHTYASPRVRDVVTQPAVSLQRGDEATVVFDGLPGDTGPDGTGDPVVHVDYFNPNTQAWEGKAYDIATTDAAPNHLGVFPVTIDTNVGIYRFVLSGRQADRHLITAISQNFTVMPADIGRVLFDAPPETASKGALFGFSFERQPGDTLFRRTVYFEGRPVTNLPPPTLVTEPNIFNGSWSIPFGAPTGQYTLRFEGADRSGNHIDVVLPPVNVLSAQLAGKIVGNAGRSVPRGTPATVLFGFTYPTGEFYLDPNLPRASVYNASGLVADAAVTRQGLTFQASWTAPAQADSSTDYWFEMSGDASAGDTFPTLRSASFRLSPGSFSRGPAADIPESNTRGAGAVTLQVPMTDDDAFVQFSLEYYGATSDVSAQIFGGTPPVSVTLLPHTVDPSTGRYVAKLVTDQQTAPGSYRIVMKGQDKHGNDIVANSRPFLIRTSTITIFWDGSLPSGSLQEGKPFTTSFVARYGTGLVMDDTAGKPSVALLLEGRPSKVRPDIAYNNGHWIVTWQAPDALPKGSYVFTVGGADFAGNQILTSQQNAVDYDPSFTNSLEKVAPHLLPVPGPEPAILLAGAALVALLLRRRQ